MSEIIYDGDAIKISSNGLIYRKFPIIEYSEKDTEMQMITITNTLAKIGDGIYDQKEKETDNAFLKELGIKSEDNINK